MRGISEERLHQIIDSFLVNDMLFDDLRSLLISECKEINPWLPIDENTPKDKYFNLFVPGYRVITGKIDTKVLDVNGIYLYPTHYQELPDDPV